jgi:hypothetical protein
VDELEHPNVAIIRDLLVGVHRRLDGGGDGRSSDPMAEDVVVHFDPGADHEIAGSYLGDEGRRKMSELLQELSGGTLRPEIHDIVGGDGWAAMSFTIVAFVGQERFSWTASSEFRFEGDKIVEDWIRPVPRHEVERFIAAARRTTSN